MAARPWMKFYPSDWRADPLLRVCSIGARGLWIEMLAIMHEAEPYGSLLVNGKPPTDQQLAALVGVGIDEAKTLLAELEEQAVFSRDRNGTIYSRRMKNDEKRAVHARKIGKKGGNPKLGKQTRNGAQDNPPLIPQDNHEDKGGVKTQRPESRVQSNTVETDTSVSGLPLTDQNHSDVHGGKPPTSYAFFGRTIKLNDRDLEKWRRTYHAIGDMEAELTTLDAWWEDQPGDRRQRWFHATAGMLNRKHQEILAVREESRRGEGGLSVPC